MPEDHQKKDENPIDDRQMPLLDHLIEFRNRLMYSVIALMVGFVVCYVFASDIYAFLVNPLAEALEGENRRLIYTGLTEVFFTYMKVAFFAGLFLTFPIIASQLYLFIAPGLYKTEKHAFLPFLLEKTGSEAITTLYDRMVSNRSRLSGPHSVSAVSE